MNFSKEGAFILFRFVLPLAILLIQLVLYKRVTRWLLGRFPTSAWMRIVARLPFVVFNVAFVAVFILRPRTLDFPHWFMIAGVYPFYIWHGATFFIGFILLLSKLVSLPLTASLWLAHRIAPARAALNRFTAKNSFQQFDASRRTFLRRGMYGLTAVSFTGTAYGLIHEKSSYEMTDATFLIPNLHEALDGFTIGLISDIHSSMFMTKTDMDKFVQLLNSLHTDLIAIPGDFVNSLTEEVYPFAESFSHARAPLGVYGVMGNHDFFAPRPDIVAKEVDSCGVKLLRNDRLSIKRGVGEFYLLGVDDTGRPEWAAEEMDEALTSARSDIPKILLCHRPYFLGEAAERDIDLVLSGHTHGGQIVLGHVGDIRIAPASLASKYVWGRYRLGRTHMYVSRGIGTVGLPIRINCPPEITRITLRRSEIALSTPIRERTASA